MTPPSGVGPVAFNIPEKAETIAPERAKAAGKKSVVSRILCKRHVASGQGPQFPGPPVV
jgi:hypothetical protein